MKIQRGWRNYKRWVIFPKIIHEIKQRSATMIKAYMKGYLTKRNIEKFVANLRIEALDKYFGKLRNQLIVDS